MFKDAKKLSTSQMKVLKLVNVFNLKGKNNLLVNISETK